MGVRGQRRRGRGASHGGRSLSGGRITRPARVWTGPGGLFGLLGSLRVGRAGPDGDDELGLGLGSLDKGVGRATGCNGRSGTGNESPGAVDSLASSLGGGVGRDGTDAGGREMFRLEGVGGARVDDGGGLGGRGTAGVVIVVRHCFPVLDAGDLGRGDKNIRLRTDRAPEANSTT
jgi:hypothetical protein